MATLTVRNLDDVVVRQLRIRAAEHREILKTVLTVCKPASPGVQAGVRALERVCADKRQSGVRCCSMYWRIMLIGAPPQDAAK
jgi:plasmid stability protein